MSQSVLTEPSFASLGVPTALVATLAAMILLPFGILAASAAPASATATEYVYWANRAGDTIGRANTDGTGVNQSYITGANAPTGVAVTATHIFWTNYYDDTIGRANLDGTGANQNFITGANAPNQLFASSVNLYWTNFGNNTIGRANLDGTGPNQNFITGTAGPTGVASTSTNIYWLNIDDGTIGTANLDGSGVNQDLLSLEAGSSGEGLAATSTHLYWTDSNVAAIGRANVDGTSPQGDFITGADGPGGIAVTTMNSGPEPDPGADAFPAKGCVTAGSATSVPQAGTKRLMKPKCVTNSGARIGVKASAQQRGDIQTFALFCKTSNGKISKTKATGNAGTRYCKKGALNIRTQGAKLRLRVTWKAPATGDFAAYAKVRNYRT